MSYTFCTRAQIERRLSAEGVLSRLDHDEDGALSPEEEAALADAIDDASQTIQFYLWAKYDPAIMGNYSWVQHRAVDYATYLLCGFRGNPVPDSVYERVEKAQAFLEAVQQGKATVPGLPLRRRLAPQWSNVRVEVGYQFKCIRVEPNTSAPHSGKYTQQTDYEALYRFEL